MKDNKENRERERTEQEIMIGDELRAFFNELASRDDDLIDDLEDENFDEDGGESGGDGFEDPL